MVALALVFLTYSPPARAYFHWLKNYLNPLNDTAARRPLLLFAGIVLLIGWTVYLRATLRSLGILGLMLAGAFFGVLLWLAIDFMRLLAANSVIVINLVLVVFSGVLATGISWSHMRQRITGQTDVDDVA